MNPIFKQARLLFAIYLTSMLHSAPLAEGASKFLGNITTNGAVRSDFGTYWNQITAENECKWASIEGIRGQYNFRGCDATYNWAKNNGGYFKFHALVWGSQYPNWLNGLSVEETKKAITAWFDAVAKQYPDLQMIDVVNEAIRTGNGQYHSGFGKDNNIIPALGGDNNGDYTFVTTAFHMARERWPNAILIYNDYNTFRWQINEGIDLIKKIKAAGAPVDAYGLQAHDLTEMEYSEFKAALQKIYDQTKLPLFISEYDIGTDNDALQLQRYKEQIPEFMNAEYVAGITLWGYIYGSTWTTNGNSGIIKNGVDRPAMTWLKEYMANNKGVNTTGLFDKSSLPVDTVPQEPYKGVLTIPGTIEAEDYDLGGQNKSYFDMDLENQGGEYREDGVDIVKTSDGYAIGYTEAGEWLEYTVNVEKEGVFTIDSKVSSSETSSFRLFLDDVAITDTIKVESTGDWDTYNIITTKSSKLPKGTHTLKILITGSFVNIDWLKFEEESLHIQNASQSITKSKTQEFKVYHLNGALLGIFNSKNIHTLRQQLQKTKIKAGVYYIRTKNGNHNRLIDIKK
ncbi:MAG: carbohydrate-binding protein [Fibrobacter sp.]|nr:carbohydrate-binding protein [Fibrobacter sp.]